MITFQRRLLPIFYLLMLHAAWYQVAAQAVDTIYLASGEILVGEVRIEKADIAEVSIIPPSGTEEVIDIIQIDRIHLQEGRRYLTSTTLLDTSRLTTSALTYDKQPAWKTTTVLLQQIVGGEVSLYFHQDATGKSHFFVQRGGKPVEALVYTRYLADINGQVVNREYRHFTKQLSDLFPSCGFVFPLIQEANYQWADLSRIVSAGNENCLGQNEEEIFLAEIPKASLELEFLLGAGTAYSHFWGESLPYNMADMSIGLRPGWSASVGVLYSPAAIRDQISFVAELGLTTLVQTGEFLDYESEEIYRLDLLTLNYQYAYLMLGGRLFLAGNLRPFLSAGISSAYMIQPEAIVQSDIRFYTSFRESEDPVPYNIRRNEAAIVFGGGIQPGRFTVRGNLRIGNGSTNDVNEASFHLIGRLSVGIRL